MNTKNYPSSIRLIFTLAIPALLVSANLTFAQEKKPAELSEFFNLVEQETEPITTGVSRPTLMKDVPASITVVTADEIKLLGMRNLTDVIDFIVPGGIGGIHRSSRTGLYAFRGITVDNNGKYVFMVDGLNCGNLTQWGAFNERFLGLMDDLDRIEIIQGTGSILYGSGAISGIINFITKTGADFQGREVTAGYGSWDKYETSLKFGEQVSPDNDSFYYAAFKNSHGTRPSGGTPNSTTGVFGRDEHAGLGRNWDHFDNSGKFQANIHRGDWMIRARFVQDRFEEPFTKANNFLNTSDNFWFENYLFIQPEYTKKLSDNSSIKANISLVMNESGMEKIRDWSAPPVFIGEGHKQSTSGERKFRGQLFHYYDGFANHKLTTGIELFWMRSGPDFLGENYTIARRSGQKSEVKVVTPESLYFAAGFFEDVWKFSDKTTFFAGARLENHKKTPANISPRVAVSYDYTPKTNFKLLYNRGFRTPDWVYYSYNEQNNLPDPEPEKVDSFEGHITHRFSPKLSMTTIGYYTIYKDLINFWNVDSVGAYRNYPTVRAVGVEVSGDYRSEDFKLSVCHSYSKPYHINADNFDQIVLSYDQSNWAQFPTNMTKAHAIVPIVKDKCMLGLTYLHLWGIKGQQNAAEKLQRGADYLNATLTFILNKNLELQFSGYNLTGEDHPWWDANTQNGDSRDVIEHRSFFGRLIWRF